MSKSKTTPANTLPYVTHEESTVAMFREDPVLAAEYLNQVLADGTQDELLLAMRYLTSAFGGIPAIARATKLNARTLYRTLSKHGNPELHTFTSLLKAMGMRIAVAPVKSPVKARVRRRVVEKVA